MIAADLLSNDMVPLRTSDSGQVALEIMHEFYVQHVPIVNDRQLLGLLSEDDVLEQDVEAAVGSYAISNIHAKVRETDHLYEVMRLVAQRDLTLVPVVDLKDEYLGMITIVDLLQAFSRTATFVERGAIIVLEVQRRDYSLSEIARIAESEDVILLSAFASISGEDSLMQVTLKLNRENATPVTHAFERFGYEVKASFDEGDVYNTLRDRYDALMSYLNV